MRRFPVKMHCVARPGIALAEVVCLLLIMAIFASICVPMIGKLYVANGRMKHELTWQRGVHELGLQLRRDARNATTATVDDSGKLLLNTGDAKIEYEFDGGVMRRTSQADADKLPGREGYVIANQATACFAVEADQVSVQLKIPSFRLIKQSDREIEILATKGVQP